MTFRKKPVVIQAEQYLGELIKGVCNDAACPFSSLRHVHTIHNNQAIYLEINDWIIPEPDGIHYYPCKPDVFNNTYEEVTWKAL
jgi:hypothetical protein